MTNEIYLNKTVLKGSGCMLTGCSPVIYKALRPKNETYVHYTEHMPLWID